tara:strand:+ start:707 stop:1444 length:738 start_codon:yes stop_codon:yes gene_type:complete
VNHLIKFVLSSGILILSSLSQPAYSERVNIKEFSDRLEKALNSKDESILSQSIFVENKNSLEVRKKYLNFTRKFPNAKWVVKPNRKPIDKRASVELYVTGEQELGESQYSLRSKQVLALETKNDKVTGQEIVHEYTILKTNNSSLKVTLNIPDIVLTDSRYDIDIILDKPLEDSIIAGGLIPLTNDEAKNHLNSNIQLSPMGAGGIFKSVKASSKPGKQRWAALLAHQDGLISVTKLVQVVSKLP